MLLGRDRLIHPGKGYLPKRVAPPESRFFNSGP